MDEILSKLPDGEINLIMTSLPFALNKGKPYGNVSSENLKMGVGQLPEQRLSLDKSEWTELTPSLFTWLSHAITLMNHLCRGRCRLWKLPN